MKWSIAGLTSLRDQGLRLAAGDTYVTPPGATLSVRALEGVLANDARQPGATITAVLVSAPSSGTTCWDFRTAAFAIRLPAGFGTATFSYKARAFISVATGTTTVDSLPATVTVRVASCLPAD